MTTQEPKPSAAAYEPPSRNASLIQSLRQQPNFLIEQYNQKLKAQNESKGIKKAGGIYIPPHKLRELQKEMLEASPQSEAHQKMMWELLRKSINGIVNKVNIANIQNVVVQLFNENIYRGRGLLARAIIKAQMASPNFTHVYTALIAVINTKVPEIGLIIAKRVLIQFKRSFERNNKIVCVATTRMVAHLVNQRVLGEYVALQILMILLSTPTEDSVQIACDFMIEVGQVLSELTAAGSTAIFQRFKGLLHQAQIQQKAQYSIESLFAVRKTGFKEHPGVIPELDLVEPEDQITHQLDIEEDMRGDEQLNIFKRDPRFLETEQEWEKIKMEILGEQNLARLKQPDQYEQEWDEEPAEQGIQDLTEQDLINLRKTIYLAIQSTVNFEQCAHKVLKMNIAKGYEHQLVDMVLQCSMMERIYQSFFGLLAERFCLVDQKFKELFIQAFLNHYNNIFKQEANKIRNLAHVFSHLFWRKVLDWKVFQAIRLTPDSTTAAARMFLKIFLKDMAQNMGINNLALQFQKEEMREYYQGLFPVDNPADLRFAINYYTTIGLGKLTEEMRQVLALQEEVIHQRKKQEEEAMARLLQQEQEEMMKMIVQEQQLKEEEKRAKDARLRDQRDKDRQQNYRRRSRDRKNDRKRSNSRGRHQEDQRDQEQGRGKRREKSRQRRDQQRSSPRQRSQSSQKEKQMRRDKQRERQKQRERVRERERERERERDKQRERERDKQRERERDKQRERERVKEKEKEKEKERQKQRQKQRQQEEKHRAEKQKQKKRQQQQIMAQQKQRQLQLARKQKEKRQKQQRKNRDKSQSEPKRKRKQDAAPKRKRKNSSDSETPVKKSKPIKKEVVKVVKVAQPKKPKSSDSDQQSSSDIQSSSSSSQNESSSSSVNQPKKKNPVKKPVSISSSDSDESSQSSSSNQEEAKAKGKKARVRSESSS